MPDAQHYLKKLNSNLNFDFNVKVKTARNELYSKKNTDIWFKEHYDGLVESIHYTQYTGIKPIEDKDIFCKKNNAHIFVDDTWDHIYATAKLLPNTLTLLYTQSRNTHIKKDQFQSNITRVKKWSEVYKKIMNYAQKLKTFPTIEIADRRYC